MLIYILIGIISAILYAKYYPNDDSTYTFNSAAFIFWILIVPFLICNLFAIWFDKTNTARLNSIKAKKKLIDEQQKLIDEELKNL